jgi:hypothetical protein
LNTKHRALLLTTRPMLVVPYLVKEKTDWEKISGCPWFETAASESGMTSIAFAPHPEERGRSNDDWKKLGETLRQGFARL